MDIGGLLTALIGAGFGYAYFVRYQAVIRKLCFHLRLFLDDAHFAYCYGLLENHQYYDYFRVQLDFLPQIQHADALHRGRLSARKQLTVMYRTLGKHVGLMALLYFAAPIGLFLVLGMGGYFLAGLFITIAVGIGYDLLLNSGNGAVLHARLSTLLKHAYSAAGYRRSAAHAQPATPASPAAPQTGHAPEAYPLPAPAAASTHAIPAATVPVPTTPETSDDAESLRFAKSSARQLHDRLTFRNTWWGIDALLCIGVTVYFWATDAHTIVDFLLMPLLYVLFLQVFFVPMWFTIRTARKMLASNA